MIDGLAGVPAALSPLGRKDFAPNDQVRWCPGCGDHAILTTLQGVLADLGIRRENVVVVSGIGCASRLPYYLDCYGLHSIHGRAPAIATAIAMARPDLSVWVVAGDGDALSIGGNHLIHALRRNVNLNILVFNNRIYGLTKGQASPTSAPGAITPSTPAGLVDAPFNPIALALGAGATFVARSLDSSRAQLAEVLTAAARHRGASMVEIYQNCHIFNDGAFDTLRGPGSGLIPLRDGQPIVFGENDSLGVVRRPDGSLAVADVAEVGLPNVVIHDAHATDPGIAFELAQLTDTVALSQAPVGIFRDVDAPAYDDQARAQVSVADDPTERLAAVQRDITGTDAWTIGAENH